MAELTIVSPRLSWNSPQASYNPDFDLQIRQKRMVVKIPNPVASELQLFQTIFT